MSRSARLLALVTDAFGAGGGIAQYNRDFLSAAAATKQFGRIDVFPRLAGEIDRPLPPGVRQYAARRAKFPYALGSLALAHRLRPDIVFCGHLFMAPLCLLLARQVGARLLVQTHGVEIWDPPSKAQRLALEAADLVLAVSRDTRRRVLEWSVNDPENVAVISNTVGDEFTPGDGSAMRTRMGLTGRKVLLSVSRLDARQRYKGQDRVIPLLPRLSELGHDVVYLIAGSGDDRPRLEALAGAHGVSDRVRFLGKVPDDDLASLYRAADLFVMPSSGEGFGIVFIQAMACGTPAIGLAVGGATDALCDGALGVAVSEAGLARAIDQQLRRGRPDGAQLHQAVQAKFGAPAFQDRVRAVMTELL